MTLDKEDVQTVREIAHLIRSGVVYVNLASGGTYRFTGTTADVLDRILLGLEPADATGPSRDH